MLPGLPPTPPGTDRFLFGALGAGAESVASGAVATGYLTVTDRAGGVIAAAGYTSVGELDGAQVTIGANAARGGRGAQVSVGANYAGGFFSGLQATSGLNIAAGGFSGLQATPGLNVAAGAGSHGVQVGGVNVAQGFGGLQLSLINYGRDVNGLQLGLINIARNVNGAQVGLVNVSKDVRGTPVGLVSVEKKGRHDVLAYASTSDLANLEFKLGGDYLHTVIGVGGGPGQPYASAGLGLQIPAKRTWIDLDGLAAAYLALGTTRIGGDVPEGRRLRQPADCRLPRPHDGRLPDLPRVRALRRHRRQLPPPRAAARRARTPDPPDPGGRAVRGVALAHRGPAVLGSGAREPHRTGGVRRYAAMAEATGGRLAPIYDEDCGLVDLERALEGIVAAP